MSAWLEPATDVVAVSPVSTAPGAVAGVGVYRAILVDTAGTYEIATARRPAVWTSVYLAAGINAISFYAVHTGAVAGNVWGIR